MGLQAGRAAVAVDEGVDPRQPLMRARDFYQDAFRPLPIDGIESSQEAGNRFPGRRHMLAYLDVGKSQSAGLDDDMIVCRSVRF